LILSMFHLVNYFVNRQFWLSYKNGHWYLNIKEPITTDHSLYATKGIVTEARFTSVEDLQRALLTGTASDDTAYCIRCLVGEDRSAKITNVFPLDDIRFPEQVELEYICLLPKLTLQFKVTDLDGPDPAYEVLTINMYPKSFADQLKRFTKTTASPHTATVVEVEKIGGTGTLIEDPFYYQKYFTRELHYTIEEGSHCYYVKEFYQTISPEEDKIVRTDILYHNEDYDVVFEIWVLREEDLSVDWITAFRYESFWEKLFS